MKSVVVLLLATLMAIALPLMSAQSFPSDPGSVNDWYDNLPRAEKMVTRLHFYFHNIASGNDPTAVAVASANTTSSSPTAFGLVRVFDNPLTTGGSRSSRVVGYGQGMFAMSSKEELSLLFAFTFYFTEGTYFAGSTLSVLGRNPLGVQYREMPIVGGTKYFREATGTAIASTYSSDEHDATFEFWLTVSHYTFGPLASKGEGFVKDM